jgi:glycerol uptake operon antiterminator
MASLINRCFAKPIIPVLWDASQHRDSLVHASAVFLQGGKLTELPRVMAVFRDPRLEHIALFLHIDLVAGLENNEAGLEYLAEYSQLTGIVTVHHHLTAAAKRMNLLTVVRLFLSDTRAVERGLAVVGKSKPNAIEILPAAVALKVADDFRALPIPRITGGLCRTEADVTEAIGSGCLAVTTTRQELWALNAQSR